MKKFYSKIIEVKVLLLILQNETTFFGTKHLLFLNVKE